MFLLMAADSATTIKISKTLLVIAAFKMLST